MSSHHPPPSGFAPHSSHPPQQQNASFAQQQAFLAQYTAANGGQQPGYGSIPPHLLQQNFRAPQQQQQQQGWPQVDTSNPSFPPQGQPSASSSNFNSPASAHPSGFPNGVNPYGAYGNSQQGGHPPQPPHRSHSNLSQPPSATPFMGAASPSMYNQQQQNPSASSSSSQQFNQQSQMLPPTSTASPRPSSKRKHRASTGPGGATGSPLVASASIPSPAQQSRPSPMAMGGYDLGSLANGFPGMQGGQNNQQLQAAFMAQRLQAQAQQQSQLQHQSPGSFAHGASYSNTPHQKTASSAIFANQSPNVNGQNAGLPSAQIYPPMPPPNPSLPAFFGVNSLPPHQREYANNPYALQLLYKDQPNILETIRKMMVASKRQGEGVPGMPGSLEQHARKVSFGANQQPQQQGGGTPRGAGAGMQNMMLPPSKARTSTSNNLNHSTPTSSSTDLLPTNSLGRSSMQAPATPTPMSNHQNHPSLGLPVAPPPPLSRFPSRPSSPPEWTGSIHPSTLPVTYVKSLQPSKLEMKDPTFGGELPEISKTEIKHVQLWMKKDKEYLSQVGEQRQLIKGKLAKAGRGIGRKAEPGWWEGDGGKRRADWEGDRAGLEAFRMEWPGAKKAKREERTGRKEVRFSKADMKQVADKEEQLVPIRLEIDYDPFKFRDTFTWNASDPLITPEMFAQTLIDDFHLPSHFRLKIVTAINDQVTEYKDLLARTTRASALEGVMSTRGKLEEDEEKWWTTIKSEGRSLGRKAATAKILGGGGAAAAAEGKGKGRVVDSDEEGGEEDEKAKAERALTVGELGTKPSEFGHDEMRITVQIDITVGRVNLKDTFEWDANGPDSAVEEFAEVMAADLGLPGEFRTAIAHDIREQCFSYLKSLILVGHPFDGTAIQDEELRLAFLPPVSSAMRTEDVSSSSFTPHLQELDDADIEKAEKEREKELRRKKRQTKGRRGVALPEREPNKTKRTIPSLGKPGPTDNSGLPIPAPGPPGTSMPVPPSPPVIAKTSRRAAALAASAHIASIAKDDFIDDYENPRRSPSPPPDKKRLGQTSSHPHPTSSLPFSSTPQHGASTSHHQQPASTPYSTSVPLANRTSNGHHPQQQYPPQSGNPYAQTFHPSQQHQPSNPSFGNPAVSSSRQGSQQNAPPFNQQQQQQQQYQQQHAQRPQQQQQQAPPPQQASAAAQEAALNSTRGRRGELSPVQTPSSTPATERPRRGTKNSDAGLVSDSSRPSGLVKEDSRSRSRANGMPSPSKKKEDDKDGGSPLSFHDVASPDSSSSELSNTPGQQKDKALLSDDHVKQVKPLSAVTNSTPGTATIPPSWITAASDVLRKKYPDDLFSLVPKPKKVNEVRPPGAPAEWRIKCLDCPGKVYDPGAGPLLDNFTVHLNNRNHRAAVNARKEKEKEGN